MIFSTKAGTLEQLQSKITQGTVLPQIRFTVGEWEKGPCEIFDRVRMRQWDGIPLIVRSSALGEDGSGNSLAGHYVSVPDVVGLDQLQAAIKRTIASYGNETRENQIFLQPMIRDIAVSGVVFTRDPNTGGPYIVVNYDDQSATADTVTSGTSNDLKTFIHYRWSETAPDGWFGNLIKLCRELEQIFSTDCLDIEFAINKGEELTLLQVRPLNVPERPIDKVRHTKAIADILEKTSRLMKRHPYLCGDRTVFGVMPDWNPAEIVGIRPRPLALSLYKELITDNIWAYQRDNYGYKNLRSFPLLVHFHGLPYIDVRVDFNSFIPADITDDLAERLVNHYLHHLLTFPSFHDKVEFEIVYSCYTFDLPERLGRLRENGFNGRDCATLEESLRRLTNKIIHGEQGLWRQDIDKIHQLEKRFDIIFGSPLDPVSKIYWLIEDCKRYGTLPFAGLARAGFIAVQLLKSLIHVGIITKDEYAHFMTGLDSVSSRMTRDLSVKSREEFLAIYGHLRPGTYDILSPRYDEDPERYFDWSQESQGSSEEKSHGGFSLSLPQLKTIEKYLREHRLDHDVLGLFEFIKQAIEGREYSKFIFTKSLSHVLSLIKNLGAEFQMTSDDLSYCNIKAILDLYSCSADVRDALTKSMEKGRQSFAITQQIILPPLITDTRDVATFHLPQFEPNFITTGKAAGHTAFVNDERGKLIRSILMIPSADPGYDWIFSQKISGFITMYGGMNSHMAIRAGELGIPAIIGAGESLFNKWSQARHLEIDCLSRQVQIIR